MHMFSRLTRLIRRKHSPFEQGEIDRALHSDITRLRGIEPDTQYQWVQLKSVLDQESRRLLPHRAPVRSFILRPAFAIAVVCLIVIGISIVWLLPSSSAGTYRTERGQMTTVLLADSSEVTLHHTSMLTVDRMAPERERHVTISGEAYFRVRTTGTPFIVSNRIGTIQVLGTEFNVRERDDCLEVAVVRGKVQVGAHADGRDSLVVLSAGQFVTCLAGRFPGSPRLLEFSDYPGWIHGKFLFRQLPLLSACREIEDRFDVQISIRDTSLFSQTITGTIDARSVESAVATLARLIGTRYRHANDGYTLY